MYGSQKVFLSPKKNGYYNKLITYLHIKNISEITDIIILLLLLFCVRQIYGSFIRINFKPGYNISFYRTNQNGVGNGKVVSVILCQ